MHSHSLGYRFTRHITVSTPESIAQVLPQAGSQANLSIWPVEVVVEPATDYLHNQHADVKSATCTFINVCIVVLLRRPLSNNVPFLCSSHNSPGLFIFLYILPWSTCSFMAESSDLSLIPANTQYL